MADCVIWDLSKHQTRFNFHRLEGGFACSRTFDRTCGWKRAGAPGYTGRVPPMGRDYTGRDGA
jgi:hypothetical protein